MKVLIKITLAALVLMLYPIASYADWNGHGGGSWHGGGGNWHGGGGWHDHGYIGVNLGVWPSDYYYAPAYYPPVDDTGVLVASPAYEPEVINGTTYYLNNGAYYVYNGYGYESVAPPVESVQPPQPVPVAAASLPEDTPDSITINIPNAQGGYTPVTLKKSGNGFIGPQGEFYTEFPSVSQLKLMYGK